MNQKNWNLQSYKQLNDTMPENQEGVMKSEIDKSHNPLIGSGDDVARRYYRTWDSADSKRQKGDRIYYKAGMGYYIVRPKKPRQWWDIL